MSLEGHQTCPHCRALVQSTICSICGKSAYEDVAPPAPVAARKWTDSFENHELRKLGIGFGTILLIGGALAFILTRSDAPPSANALPPPAPTTPIEAQPPASEFAPSLVGGARPASGFVPGAPREVGEGLAPWETPPPIDFVTGLLLDETIDYQADIALVAELLDAFPDDLTTSPLDPPELLTYGGRLDAEQVEATQPFAARTLRRDDGAVVGELWIIASSGSEAGDAYLAAARSRWNVDAAIDQFSHDVGVRLWLLGADERQNLWAGDLSADAIVLVQAPVEVDPRVLGDALRAWRRAL